MADPKDHDPEMDPLSMFGEEAAPEPGAELPSAESFEEFNFDAPGETNVADAAEGLDIGESADMAFPSEAAGAAEMPPEFDAVADQSMSIDGMFAETGEGVTDFAALDESPVASEVVGEGIEEAATDEGEAKVPAAPKKAAAWLGYVDWIGALLAAIVIWLVVSMLTSHVLWHASFYILLLLVPFALWKSRKRWATPTVTATYTLMLAIGFTGLLCGVYWLGLELQRYDWDLKAKTAPRAGAVYAQAAASVPSAPATVPVAPPPSPAAAPATTAAPGR